MNPLTQKTTLSQLKSYVTKKWHSNSPVGSIFRNMTMLASGTIAAKTLGILTVPVITRLYQPEHFGVLSVFTAITSLIVPFGTLRYSMAIPLPRHDGMAANLAVLCGLCLLVTSSLVFFIFWLTAPALLGLLSMEQLLPFWWLLPVAIAGTGIYELLSNWAIREKAFKPLAKTKLWQALIGSSVKIGLGFLGIKPLGLLIGQVFTQAGGIFALLKSFRLKFRTSSKHVTRKRISFAAKRFADFPKYRLPSQILLLLSTKAPFLFFAWNFGSETTGQFGLAMIVLLLPLNFFGQTTSQAYYGEIAKLGVNRSEEIYKITIIITKKLFLISISPFIVLLFLGPWLFEIVFGEVWRVAGVFSSILALNLLTMFLSYPITSALNVVGRQSYYFQINFIRISLILLIFSTSYFFKLNSYVTLLIYSLVLSGHRFFVYFRILYIIKNYKKMHKKEYL